MPERPKKGSCERCGDYSTNRLECAECGSMMCEVCIPSDGELPCIDCDVELELAGTEEKDDYGC